MEEVPPAANGKHKFVDHCRLLYQKNISILQSIDEFERDYKSTDAVRWYTREGFLYKVLNQALREQNSKTLRLRSQPTVDRCTEEQGRSVSNVDEQG